MSGEPVVLSEWERDVLHAAAMIQVDKFHEGRTLDDKADPVKADRWRTIADAIKVGTPVVYTPPKRSN